MTPGALAGVKVLDLGQDVTAPYGTRLLADYGADVIKVEPLSGDRTRRAGPFPGNVPHPEKSGMFLHTNMNKRGITLDFTSPTGAALLLELAAWADVIVENLPPGYLPSLGLSYERLAAENPRLVLTSITPFGQTGPYRDFKGTDAVIFALTPRMKVHGLPEREPLRYGPDVPSFQVANTAALATMGALLGAKLHGIGQQIDLAAMEALTNNVDSRPLSYQYSGMIVGRESLLRGYPVGPYPCLDGFMLFAASGDRFFRRLCRAIGMPELLEDERFASPLTRAMYKDDFDVLFLPWLIERTRSEVFTTCQAEGVMCAPINYIDELFESPQFLAREFFTEVEHPALGKVTVPGAPFRMSKTPWAISRPAPLLGQHNQDVYCGLLGHTTEELARLSAHGII